MTTENQRLRDLIDSAIRDLDKLGQHTLADIYRQELLKIGTDNPSNN